MQSWDKIITKVKRKKKGKAQKEEEEVWTKEQQTALEAALGAVLCDVAIFIYNYIYIVVMCMGNDLCTNLLQLFRLFVCYLQLFGFWRELGVPEDVNRPDKLLQP